MRRLARAPYYIRLWREAASVPHLVAYQALELAILTRSTSRSRHNSGQCSGYSGTVRVHSDLGADIADGLTAAGDPPLPLLRSRVATDVDQVHGLVDRRVDGLIVRPFSPRAAKILLKRIVAAGSVTVGSSADTRSAVRGRL